MSLAQGACPGKFSLMEDFSPHFLLFLHGTQNTLSLFSDGSGSWVSKREADWESASWISGHRRRGFSPWIRKVPWKRKWQPTPVILPGESHGQRSLVGYSPWACKETRRSDSTTTTTKARRWTQKMYLLICWYLTLKANSSQWLTHGDWSVSFACLWTSYLLSYHHLPLLSFTISLSSVEYLLNL